MTSRVSRSQMANGYVDECIGKNLVAILVAVYSTALNPAETTQMELFSRQFCGFPSVNSCKDMNTSYCVTTLVYM